jgi:hypothetical protein
VIRKSSRGLQAGMEDTTVPGEGGEAPMSPTGGDTAPYVTDTYDMDYDYGTTDAGSTKGISTLQLEVAILSSGAIDRVSHEIARRGAAKLRAADINAVTIASPSVIAFLRLHSAFEAEVASLEAVTKRLASAKPADIGPIQTEDTSALAIPVFAATEGVRRVVQSASTALKSLAATTTYSGRSGITRQPVLDAALAKHLAHHNLDVELPEHSLPSTEPRGLFARVLNLQNRCRELQRSGADPDLVSQVQNSVESIVSVFSGTTSDGGTASAVIAQQLMLADGVARGLAKGRAVLFAEIAFSGGSYRTRKWIFNFLFGRDGLTYSGGAGVTYFLFRADDRRTLDSDTLYFASPHGRFEHDRTRPFKPSNLTN